MRSLACLVLGVVCSLTGPGCAAFGKKGGGAKDGGAGSGAAPAKFPTTSDPLLNSGSGANASRDRGSAVLAGRVIDNASRPPANTSIRLVSVDGKETGNPTEVSVTPEGYFTIQGLKSGSNYKLLARGKNGERLMAGITYTTAPNLAVVIQVKEDFATSATPDVPGSPAFQDSSKTSNNSSSDAALPAMSLGGPRGNEFETPAVAVPIPDRAPTPVATGNQNWTPGPNVAVDRGSTWPPPLDIPNPTVKPTPPPLAIPKPPPPLPPPELPRSNPFPGDSLLDAPARVPSCVLVGRELKNLALNDVNGETWEFKRNRRGKLVLFDFWGTTCIPCRESIPFLRQLQAKYGNQGLEVVGIAIESGGNPQLQAYSVNKVARSLNVNYRQLVSNSPTCPVRKDFHIEVIPTVVLVDQSGQILWQEKGPDRGKLEELERLIQRKLR